MKKRQGDKDYDQTTLEKSLATIKKKVQREKQNQLSTVSTQIESILDEELDFFEAC